MKRISSSILMMAVIFAPFQSTASKHPLSSKAKAILKGESPKKDASSTSEKAKHLPPPVIPYEYKVYETAKRDSLLPKWTAAQIETHQREMKNLQWNTINKSLEKEAEDLYWFYEIAHAEKLSGNVALNAWIKALNSLNQFKWIYSWTAQTSEALVKICKPSALKPEVKEKAGKSSKKKIAKKDSPVAIPSAPAKTPTEVTKEEKCTYLAKKVNDAFPKNAVETQPLKLWLSDLSTVDTSGDKYERLSQTYGEKTEKDEQAFAEVLDLYLNHKDDDLYKSAQAFIDAYPKSMLRFRAMFFMAERHFAAKDKKEAEDLYGQIINQIPYSYYAIVASERVGVPLKERLAKEPLSVNADPVAAKLNYLEKESFYRLQNLVRGKKQDSVSLELEQFTRLRSYPTDFLLFLIQQANQASQDLAGFRIATEILQRKNEAPLNPGFIELIFPDRFPKEIEAQAKVSQIDPLLVVSLMKQESGFKGGILSSSGAAGLMQLMPFTAIEVQKDLALRDLRNPVKNIEIGTRYLASLLNEKFNGNVVYALAGYNAGPHRVAKWRKDAHSDWGMQEFVEAIPFKETRDYVMSILRNRYWYQYRRGVPQQSVFEAWRSP